MHPINEITFSLAASASPGASQGKYILFCPHKMERHAEGYASGKAIEAGGTRLRNAQSPGGQTTLLHTFLISGSVYCVPSPWDSDF